MERLGPPLIGRDIKPRNSSGLIGKLLYLFREGEEGDERLSSGRYGEGSVAEGIFTIGWWHTWELWMS